MSEVGRRQSVKKKPLLGRLSLKTSFAAADKLIQMEGSRCTRTSSLLESVVTPAGPEDSSSSTSVVLQLESLKLLGDNGAATCSVGQIEQQYASENSNLSTRDFYGGKTEGSG